MKHSLSMRQYEAEPTMVEQQGTKGNLLMLNCFIITKQNYLIFFFSRTPNDRSDLMVKKLRYYARFIVVCLLLKKMKLVRDLVRELSKLIGNGNNETFYKD